MGLDALTEIDRLVAPLKLNTHFSPPMRPRSSAATGRRSPSGTAGRCGVSE